MSLHKLKGFAQKNIDTIYVLIIVLICLLFFSPYIFSNPTPLIFPISDLGTDLNREVLPNIEFIVNSISRFGEVPLWRDFLLSGAPLVGHPLLPIFYPLYWIFLILPISFATNLIAFINFSWMGIGMYFYLRFSGKTKPTPSLIGAVAMCLFPKWIAHLSGGHWFMLTALSWAPWSLFFFERFWKQKKLIWLFLLAISLSAIANNHLPVFIIISFTLLSLSFSYLKEKFFWKWVRKMLYGWGLIICLTFLLSAGQLLPLIELLPYSSHTVGNSTFTSLHPIALLASIFPPSLKYPEWFLFPGLTVIVFSFLNSKSQLKKFEKTWLVIGLIGVLLSLGEFTPLYSLLFRWNPLISVLRVPTRWWLITIIALIVLCSSGINNWINNNYRLNKKQTMIILIFLMIEIGAGIIKAITGDLFPFDTTYIGLLAFFLSVIIIFGHFKPNNFMPFAISLLLVFEIFIIWKSLIQPQLLSISDSDRQKTSQLKSNLQNYERIYSPEKGFSQYELVHENILSADGYDPFPLKNYMKFIQIATGCSLIQDSINFQERSKTCLISSEMRLDWLKLINVRYLIVQKNDQMNIAELLSGPGRIFSIQKIENTTNNQCFDDLKKINTEKVALIEGKVIDSEDSAFEILDQKKSANKETFYLQVFNSPMLLIRSENWAPGWKVIVNGKAETIYRVDCILQGVWLEAGNQTVEFIYQPYGYPFGFWISTLTLIGILIYCINYFIIKFSSHLNIKEKKSCNCKQG